MRKESVFTVKLEPELRDAFMAEAEDTHRPASHLVREFMRDFVRHQREARERDAWFRAKVQEPLDDQRPSIPHDVVMGDTRLLGRLSSICAGTRRRRMYGHGFTATQVRSTLTGGGKCRHHAGSGLLH
jgi:predicted transcriptional regulator